ncbi:hypothetical protein FA13DRAFT_1752294 [Coprinellus micaceus]|uniref:TECPR1-like DysF domain-containing protein n=1 Tax=Coprinellus micaceus TaxID=71717 RepID=A0A4Y7TUF1_COPMI|nr:hypothetical protein FA13DRAFT_1752294 [Coprinellus micaceus]
MSFVLSDFVQSVPSPLTFALVSLSDVISATKNVLGILNWRSGSLFDGYLLVFGWWAVCLFADAVLRYHLPLAILASTVYRRSRKSTNKQIVTEQVLANAVADLAIIPTLLPTAPSLPAIPLRALAILYAPYLLLTTFVPLRIILALRRDPVVLRRVVWRSAYVRWTVYTAWAFVSGTPLPPKSISPQTRTLQSVASQSDSTQDGTSTSPGSGADADASTNTASTLRFLFTVYENQRWWMGLDWTAALLPGERPSWCSSPPTLAPLSPPGAFPLPEPTTVYLLHPTDEKKRIKRTAEWYWEEPEWTVLVRKEGGVLSRVERPVPVAVEEGPNAKEGTGSRLFKAASNRFTGVKEKDSRDTSSVHSREDSGHGEEVEVIGRGENANEPFTDPDGWVFGDNKWENQSNKGGISKYTRFRRWTRVAVLTEFVQVVDASEDTPQTTKPRPFSTSSSTTLPNPPKRDASPSTLRRSTLPPMNLSKEGAAPHISPPAAVSPVASSTTANAGPSLCLDKVDSPLRQRLRNALNK